MRTLPPQFLRPRDYSDMEIQLIDIFRKIIFQPIFDVLAPANAQVRSAIKDLRNAGDDALKAALKSGRVQYRDGVFSGEFNRAIADAIRKLGADFDARSKIYRLNPAQVPPWVKAEAALYEEIARAAHEAVKRMLNDMQEKIDLAVESNPVNADQTVESISQRFETIAKSLEVMPELTPENKARFSAEYSTNMKLWIKNFTQAQIEDLRMAVDYNATQGYRFDRLVTTIESRYKTNQTKAKFLARQETSLFMSKFRQLRFSEMGVTRYQWDSSGDARVRPDHKKLDGKIFSYDQPPIVDSRTGRRANPGQDFNCRCVDVPILDPIEVGAAA